MKKLSALIFAFLTSCTGIPEGVSVVDDFEVKRYLGTWYEIARLDHRFERGLNNISASYTLRDDGGINVINKGWDQQKNEWKQAEGKAYFIDQPDQGRLKVSFFGPFYGSYNIIALDKKNYGFSMVCGPDKSYFWILSRTRQLPKETLDALVEVAKQQGFATGKLIFVRQD
ncbi:MAG: lipocalin family protein [Methylococcales bacterium]|nr:lipocalin family protein [Methylococcales bacterium]